jgi:hypothetical protein
LELRNFANEFARKAGAKSALHECQDFFPMFAEFIARKPTESVFQFPFELSDRAQCWWGQTSSLTVFSQFYLRAALAYEVGIGNGALVESRISPCWRETIESDDRL